MRTVAHLDLEAMPAPALLVDAEGRVAGTNEALRAILGYSPEDGALGGLFEEAPAAEALRSEATRARSEGRDLELRRAEGRAARMRFRAGPVLDREGWTLWIGVDVSSHRGELEETQRRQSLLADAEPLAQIGSFEWDIPQNRVSWSDGLYRIYGLEPRQFGASFEAFLAQVHPDSRDHVRATIEDAYRTGAPFSMEERIVRPDGEERMLFSKGHVVRDETGAPVRIVGTCQDVTERKRAERVLSDYREALEREVRERTAELVEANSRLKETLGRLGETERQLALRERMAALGNLVAGVSHEMNTPLGVILSMSDTVGRAASRLAETARGVAKGAKERRELEAPARSLEDARRVLGTASERLAAIVAGLRSFARLDESETKLADLHEGIEAALRLLQHRLENRIRVERRFGEIPPVLCRPGELNQVFVNLFLNAIESIDAEGTIDVETTRAAQQVRVAFRDDGRGIPPDHLERVLEPGFTTKGVRVGTGLGLPTAYQIVKEHHGSLELASEPGRGTTVTVTLPLSRP